MEPQLIAVWRNREWEGVGGAVGGGGGVAFRNETNHDIILLQTKAAHRWLRVSLAAISEVAMQTRCVSQSNTGSRTVTGAN